MNINKRYKRELTLVTERNMEGHYLYVSEDVNELLGYVPKELIGSYCKNIIHSEDYMNLLYDFKEKMNKQDVFQYVYRMRKKNGSYVWVETTLTIIRDPKTKEPKKIHTVSNKVNQGDETEKLVVDTEKTASVRQIATGISQEMNNPITKLKGFLKLMKAGELDRDYLNVMEKELESIQKIFSELQILSETDTTNEYVEQDVIHILEDAIGVVTSQAAESGKRIIMVLKCKDLLIVCNEMEIKQAIINLLNNALEATGFGSIIRIVVRKDNKHRYIEIIDDGHGIPEHTLSRVGEPFFTTKQNGKGLGVLISHNIIKAHSGTLSFSSKINIGTKATITLPHC